MLTVEVDKQTAQEVIVSFDDEGAELLLDTLSFCREKVSDVELWRRGGGGDELSSENQSGPEYLVAFRLWIFQDRPGYNRLEGSESEMTIELFPDAGGTIADCGLVLIFNDAGNEKWASSLKELLTRGGSNVMHCDRTFHRILPIQREKEVVKPVENLALRLVYLGAGTR